MSTQFPQSIETQQVKDYLISLINPLNILNTDSGTNAVEINEPNGLAVFSQSITAGDFATFTITNSLITTSSVLQFDLKYAGDADPLIEFYDCSAGSVAIHLANISQTDDTNENLNISFKIIA
jgi:hypothetical protein